MDISGKQFNNLIAIELSHKNKVEYWKYKCILCNTETISRKPDVSRGRIKSCGCSKNVKENNGMWKGYEGIDGSTVGHYKYNANKRGIEFAVTIEELWEIYIEQNKHCPYTNIELILESNGSRVPSNSSLDRIDSDIGYVKNNLQWVYKPINVMKNKTKHNEFIRLCKLISENHS